MGSHGVDLLEKPNLRNPSNIFARTCTSEPDRMLQAINTEDSQSELRWRHGPWPIELSPRLYSLDP